MTDNNENQGLNSVKETKNNFNLLKEVWEWFYTIVIALLVVIFIKGFIFDIVRVDGPSMNPTLTHNDRLFISKLGYKPAAGDIIILDSAYKNREAYYAESGKNPSGISKFFMYFELPEDLKHRYYVKRIIGMPGDKISIIEGRVYVNDKELYEPYYNGTTHMTDYSVSYPVTVEEGHVFVMGDNRGNSTDSRSSSLGQVPIEAIEGKSQFRIWPFNAIGKTE